MKLVYKRVNLDVEEKGMPVNEWNALRRAIGKPRRFSQALVNQELLQLASYREKARIWLGKKQLINDGHLPKELTRSIQALSPFQVVAGAHGRDRRSMRSTP